MDRVWSTLVVVIAGCGRIGFDPPANGDANGDASGPRGWTQVTPSASPGPVFAPKLVWHPIRQRVILYGGEDFPEMWEYDGASWSALCTPCAPGVRLGHGLAYDAARDRIVLFGGTTTGATYSNDLWEWDGATWSPGSNGAPPSPRTEVQMAYDEQRQRVVLYGGSTATGTLTETFEYDGVTWVQLAPSQNPGPSTDEGQLAVWDGVNHRVAIFGGWTVPGVRGDASWTWDGVDWTQECDPCTGTARSSPAVAWDAARSRVVVATGRKDGNDEFDGTWESIATPWPMVSDEPPSRYGASASYDARRDVIVMFGGFGADSCGGECDQTYEYRPAP